MENKVIDSQKREAVVFEGLDLLIPARLCEAGAAPRVIVEGEEIGADVIRAAVHVLGGLDTVFVDVSGGVAHRNLAKLASLDECLDITSDCLDVRGGVVLFFLANDLVAGEKGQRVVVLGKLAHGSKNVLQISGIVGKISPVRATSVKGVLGGVDIDDKVDASLVQCLHAVVVVGSVVHGVDANGVDAEVLELLDVTSANFLVGEGVDAGSVTAWLVVDTPDVETLAVGPEGCKVRLACRIGHGQRRRRERAYRCQRRTPGEACWHAWRGRR